MAGLSEYTYEWFGEKLGSTLNEWSPDQENPEDKLEDEDNNKDGDDASDGDKEPVVYEEVYYNGFTRRKSNVPLRGKKGKGRVGDTETFHVGDTVLSLSTNKSFPFIGVITSMWETNVIQGEAPKQFETGGMYVELHWFKRDRDRPKVGRKRQALKNEIYYALDDSSKVGPEDIIRHCLVIPPPEDVEQKASPKKSEQKQHVDPDAPKEFICRFAADVSAGLYYEFNWPEHHERALSNASHDDNEPWKVCVEYPKPNRKAVKMQKEQQKGKEVQRKEKKKTQKQTKEIYAEEMNIVEEMNGESSESGDDSSEEYFPGEGDEEFEESVVDEEEFEAADEEVEKDDEYESGVKKRKKQGVQSTPRKQPKINGIAAPTPHSKRVVKMKKRRKAVEAMVFRPQKTTTDYARLKSLPPDPFLRAMHVLHVGARPETLPCREDEYAQIMSAVFTLLEDNTGGCIYISGVPGAGKTATVHTIVRELKAMAERGDVNPFTYVEINGLKVPEPSAAYTVLWEALSSHDVEKEGHLKMSSKEALRNLNHYFSPNARSGPSRHACVVLMDELDQLMTQKQDIIYNFFNWPNLSKSNLIVIAVANTHDLPERAMTGKVRSRLGFSRINFHPYTRDQLCTIVQARLNSAKEGLDPDKAIDVLASDAIKFTATKIAGTSGDARRILDICRRAVELVRINNSGIVTIAHIHKVMALMQNSPTAGYLEDCSFHEKILLAALVKCIKREGVEEICWGDVTHQHSLYMNILPRSEDPKTKLTLVELALVLDSLVASKAILLEDGLAASRKAPGDRKVILNIEMGEIQRVLSELGTNWKNALGN
ncbi:hypothetical protein M422DRAFT_224152 [Sphaerobolus stellatus SS14]|nr:hypothetical protein M422DRAFT_224152 [Sphaerobolus stellatus SS14]